MAEAVGTTQHLLLQSYAERVIMSRENFKNVFLKIFQVTVSLLAVMVAVFLAHSPDEAKSNLSKWGQYLKIPNDGQRLGCEGSRKGISI
jgi:hypothetical protein